MLIKKPVKIGQIMACELWLWYPAGFRHSALHRRPVGIQINESLMIRSGRVKCYTVGNWVRYGRAPYRT